MGKSIDDKVETIAVAAGPGKVQAQVLLPANVGALAKLCAKEATRYAMQGVRLTTYPNGGYRVAATDSRRLGIVDGKEAFSPSDFPDLPAIAAAPNGATSALVPAKAWADAFRAVPKPGKVGFKEALATSAVVLGDVQTTFVSTDLETVSVMQPRNLEGRFPPVEEIMPKTDKATKFAVNAKDLVGLLQVAAQFAADGMTKVTFEVVSPTKPIVVRAENANQRFIGIIMPLT